jgi:hypothetical protein
MIEDKTIPSYMKPVVVHAGSVERLSTAEALFARADVAEASARHVEDQSLEEISAWDIATR